MMRQAACTHARLVVDFLCAAARRSRGCSTSHTRKNALEKCGPPAGGESDSAEAWFPSWFPAAYDLVTEVQFFLKDFRQARTSFLLPKSLVLCLNRASTGAPAHEHQLVLPPMMTVSLLRIARAIRRQGRCAARSRAAGQLLGRQGGAGGAQRRRACELVCKGGRLPPRGPWRPRRAGLHPPARALPGPQG